MFLLQRLNLHIEMMMTLLMWGHHSSSISSHKNKESVVVVINANNICAVLVIKRYNKPRMKRVLSSSITKGVALKSSDLDRSLTSDASRNLGLDYNTSFNSAASITSLRSRVSNASLSSSLRSRVSNASLSSSASLLKRLDLHSSTTSLLGHMASSGSCNSRTSQLSLPARFDYTGNATWDDGAVMPEKLNMFDFEVKKSKSTSSTSPKSNPFLDGTYRKVQRRNSGIRSSKDKDDHKRMLSMVSELDAAKVVQDEDDPQDEDIILPETPSKCDFDEQLLEEESFVVSTFQMKADRQLESIHLSASELSSLKEADAFMYYSIPAVKKAHWENREIDFDIELSKPVKRRRAISFETPDIDIPGVIS